MMSLSVRGASLSVAWNPSPDPRIARYEVWFAANEQAFATLDAGLATACTLTNLAENQTYYVLVCSVDNVGNRSQFGNQLAYTIPVLPIITAVPATVDFTPISVILTPGATAVVAPGANVNFQVSGTGGSLTYSWEQNGLPVSTTATNSLTLTNVTAAQGGIYTVTVANAFAGVSSAPMTLIVTPLLPGVYNGLFSETNNDGTANVNVETSGMLNNSARNY
jgi:hypothetical protein